ncbi:cytidine deaminase [Corynebacterium hansenii]|uniref:Cytidine deaminase n=1 Tax=Corynebacterium hansenii TaxID=394964 RepID=A0ABV7ZLH8_9CORY|nr:cytidine deaminase [Corynebacterium hansenii]WJY98751.1 Cytidine deaminase [Corynebacterium hansenii]
MSITDAELLERAHAATANSYVAYSGFPVGAALLLDDGTVVTGCNVENASYGLTNCGERTAVFRMVAEHGPSNHIVACAIVGRDAAPCHPCGACRQVLNEFGCERVIVEGPRPGGVAPKGGADGGDAGVVKLGEPISIDFADILPYAFGPDDLK